MLAAQAMPGFERDAYQLVKSICPEARPNPIMITYADDILNAKGRLIGWLE